MPNTTPHAAIVASPGMGHLIPAMELAKSLLTRHHMDVTVFVVTTDSSAAHSIILPYTSSLPSLIVTVFLPVTENCPDPSLEARINMSMTHSLPLLRTSISSMKHVPTLLIVDIFGTMVFPMAREFGMLCYVLFTSNAWFTATTIYVPVMDKEILLEDTSTCNEPVRIPGCKPVPFEDSLEVMVNRGSQMYKGYLKVAKDITTSADGILVNTWHDLEPTTGKALMDRDVLGGMTKGEVLFVGPLVKSMDQKPDHKENEVLKWLDEQPKESVVYVSFGSGGTMSAAQIIELAWGLELSQVRFIWVVRPPMEEDASGAFFEGVVKCIDCDDYLPEGFRRRNHKVGRVVEMWAPQVEILGHRSVGGFVTHCGWNSTLESVMSGVPMVAWPLYAEQKMNACMLVEEVGVAVRVEAAEGTVVNREEICKMVRRVMAEEEGKVIRGRVRELMLSGEMAVCEGGSSYKALCRMTKDCINRGLNGDVY